MLCPFCKKAKIIVEAYGCFTCIKRPCPCKCGYDIEMVNTLIAAFTNFNEPRFWGTAAKLPAGYSKPNSIKELFVMFIKVNKNCSLMLNFSKFISSHLPEYTNIVNKYLILL